MEKYEKLSVKFSTSHFYISYVTYNFLNCVYAIDY